MEMEMVTLTQVRPVQVQVLHTYTHHNIVRFHFLSLKRYNRSHIHSTIHTHQQHRHKQGELDQFKKCILIHILILSLPAN